MNKNNRLYIFVFFLSTLFFSQKIECFNLDYRDAGKVLTAAGVTGGVLSFILQRVFKARLKQRNRSGKSWLIDQVSRNVANKISVGGYTFFSVLFITGIALWVANKKKGCPNKNEVVKKNKETKKEILCAQKRKKHIVQHCLPLLV
ncbi:hypothetical protein KAH94_04260 [bacterium]|nr:hypothetical protein [bacterium]